VKVITWNQQQLNEIKRELLPIVRRNRSKIATTDAYSSFGGGDAGTAHRLQVVKLCLTTCRSVLFCAGMLSLFVLGTVICASLPFTKSTRAQHLPFPLCLKFTSPCTNPLGQHSPASSLRPYPSSHAPALAKLVALVWGSNRANHGTLSLPGKKPFLRKCNAGNAYPLHVC
jgi:hypothetical protein